MEDHSMEKSVKRGFLENAFQSHFWDSKIKSANVKRKERMLGYIAGPFGIMMLQSIVNSYFNQYLTDVLGFTVARGAWITTFMVAFPVFSKLLDAVTNVLMAKVIDRTTCRQGKTRPWFILSLPIVIASIMMMFAVPNMAAEKQAVWIVVAYNLFYSVGYTMWYMSYELSAALSTRNVKQRSKNSIAGQITKNIGTGTVSILFPTLLVAVCHATNSSNARGYLLLMAILCCLAVPLTFIQYFYTRERVTEERRAVAVDENLKKSTIVEATFKEQLKACFSSRYWIIFILLVFLYQVLNAMKGVSQVYYSGWVVNGNAYGNYAAIQRRFTMISMAPVGPMLLVIVPLINKYGRSKMNIIGGLIAAIGSGGAFFMPGKTLPVYLGTALSGIGSMAYMYTMMSFTGDIIDEVEYRTKVRVEGVTAALIGFMHSTANGVGMGIFNLGLMLTKYMTPQKIGVSAAGIDLYADQTAGAVNWINFSYQGSIALTGLMFFILFSTVFDIEKHLPTITESLTQRKMEQCKALGIEYIPPEVQQAKEIEQQKAEAEENRIKELREKCEKKHLDFDTENQKYLDKKAKREARKNRRKGLKK